MPDKKPAPHEQLPIPIELIERRIYLIRGQKIMLSLDLADLYQVETRALVQAVKRNADRFPEDFMFQLTDQEASRLVSQNVIPSKGMFGGSLPYAFTELGVAMLSSVLKSKRAVKMNILIMRAFVRLRELLATHKELAAKVEKLEVTQRDSAIAISLLAKDVRGLDKKVMKEFKKLREPRRKKIHIGFRAPDGDKK